MQIISFHIFSVLESRLNYHAKFIFVNYDHNQKYAKCMQYINHNQKYAKCMQYINHNQKYTNCMQYINHN